jgi:tetratricopeptide (TPR) repeat protein
MYYMGEMSYDSAQPDEARDYWERLGQQKPAGSPWRLQGLVKLGEIYEAEKNYQEAAKVYEDIARNSGKPEVARAAAERAKALLNMGKAEPAPKNPAGRKQNLPGMGAGVDEPSDEAAAAPEPVKQPAPAKKKVIRRAVKKAAPAPAARQPAAGN